MRVEVVLGPTARHAADLRRLAAGEERVLVLANDVGTRDAARAAGLTAQVLTEYLAIDSREDFDAYAHAHAQGASLARALDDVRYRGVPAFGAIEAQLVGDLVFFHRIGASLEHARQAGTTAVVLALTHYNATYVGLTATARASGHDCGSALPAGATGIAPLVAPIVGDERARALTARAAATPPPRPRPA